MGVHASQNRGGSVLAAPGAHPCRGSPAAGFTSPLLPPLCRGSPAAGLRDRRRHKLFPAFTAKASAEPRGKQAAAHPTARRRESAVASARMVQGLSWDLATQPVHTLATKFMGFCCLFFFLPWFILFCVCVWTIFKVLNLLKWCICFMFWFYCSMTCGILAPQPKMEPPSS